MQVVNNFSRKSFRLMALAVGTLPNVDSLELPALSLQQAESHVQSFELLGLIVLTNPIRADSRHTIAQLQEG